MTTEDLDKLRDQVWTTRISRVNAEKRLINKEMFFQGINIYYSCVTIIFSILSLNDTENKLSLITLFMTISLLIAILYLNAQKYLEHAREYRKNYTEIHKLESELKYVSEKDIEKILDIEKRYCDLLDSTSNHISYDYYQTVYASRGSYRDSRWKSVKYKYYFNLLWRFLIGMALVVLPFGLYIICVG